MKNYQLITSEDGSHTIYRVDLDENYHSTHGAIQESKHVFIKNGLQPLLKTKPALTILEVGMGTGLNVLLTAKEAQKNKQQIHYIAVEAYPLSNEIIEKLNYGTLLDSEKTWQKIHQIEWGRIGVVNNYLTLQKVKQKIEEFEPHKAIDLVYFDAFAPQIQSELWSFEVFDKLFNFMNTNGILVTYCAKGQVRRDLEAVGFEVERLEGPPGKREMLRAIKK